MFSEITLWLLRLSYVNNHQTPICRVTRELKRLMENLKFYIQIMAWDKASVDFRFHSSYHHFIKLITLPLPDIKKSLLAVIRLSSLFNLYLHHLLNTRKHIGQLHDQIPMYRYLSGLLIRNYYSRRFMRHYCLKNTPVVQLTSLISR